MLEYRESLYQIVLAGSDLPMERLKRFEEECQGLFAPLDLSPPTEAFTTILQHDEDAVLPLPNSSLESVSGDVGSSGQFIPESTPMAEESSAPQKTGSVHGSTPQPAERRRRWYHILFSCVT
jgi:hypothetical protein